MLIREINDKIYFHPAIYIKDLIDEGVLTHEKLSYITGLEENALKKLLEGQIKIDFLLAEKLSNGLGTSAELWINLQRKYDESDKYFELE